MTRKFKLKINLFIESGSSYYATCRMCLGSHESVQSPNLSDKAMYLVGHSGLAGNHRHGYTVFKHNINYIPHTICDITAIILDTKDINTDKVQSHYQTYTAAALSEASVGWVS